MKTQVLVDGTATAVYLEVRVPDLPVETVSLESCPLLVGRDEAAQLVLPSARVSREHALVVCDGATFRVRDLGSTNGTFLNGQRIDEAELADGDLLLIADVELTFNDRRGAEPRVAATQVLGDHRVATGSEDPLTLVREIRRLQVALTSKRLRIWFQPVVQLAGGQCHGYEAMSPPPELVAAQHDVQGYWDAIECPLGDRLRHVSRLVAARHAGTLPAEAMLFVRLHPSEIGHNALVDSLRDIRRALRDSRPLAIEVPESVASSGPYFRELRSQLVEMGVQVVYGAFSGPAARVLEHKDRPPQYIKLDGSVVRYLHRSEKRQAQVRATLETCRELGIEVIAGGINTEPEAAICRELGCVYGQGRCCGPAQPATAASDLCAA